MSFFLYFIAAFTLSLVGSIVVKHFALRIGAVDVPASAPNRKIHKRPTPLLGGIAIFLSFFIGVAFLSTWLGTVSGTFIHAKQLWGLFIASTVLMVGGFLDDRHNLKPKYQIVFPILATLIVIASGIGIRFITNPFGGVMNIETIHFTVFTWHGVPYHLTLWADAFTFLWLMGMMYTTKFLDGLDGLVAGITTIGSLAVFVLSLRLPVFQLETARLAIIFAGACAGFLVMNWHPALIFLGEGGSLLTGFILGTLAIIAGGKIATALLIMGIPILDVAWVIVRRLVVERRSPFLTADRKHLHFRLLDMGLSHRGAVVALYVLTAVFSATTLILHGIQKLIALAVLSTVMVVMASLLVIMARRRTGRETSGQQ